MSAKAFKESHEQSFQAKNSAGIKDLQNTFLYRKISIVWQNTCAILHKETPWILLKAEITEVLVEEGGFKA